MSTHKQWLDNEYDQWIAALNECTVHNFKEHPMVRRMLSLDMDVDPWYDLFQAIAQETADLINKIDLIGGDSYPKGATLRMMYYAQQIIARNPSSICEIGGGVGMPAPV